MQPELLVDVGDEREAVDVACSVGPGGNPSLRARLARNLADDAFHERLEGDEPRRAAVLVDDQRFARAPPPHLAEQVVGAQRLGDREHLAGEPAGGHRVVARRQGFQHIVHVQHAEYIVEIAAVDRQARVAPLADLHDELAQRRLGGERDQLRARDHHLARGEIGEAEDAVEHLFLLLFEHARFLACRDQHLQLFFRMDHRTAVAAPHAQRLDDALRRSVDDPDERPEHTHEDFERLDQPHGRLFRPLERDPLRCQLAEDDFGRGDDGEGDGHSDAVRGGGGEIRRHEGERGLEDRRKRRLGHPSEGQARHRDPELRRGDVSIGRGDGAAHRSRAAMSLRDQLIDARLAHRDDRELRGDEEAVGEHERQQPRQPPQRGRERLLHG